jgi:hypothetical protein
MIPDHANPSKSPGPVPAPALVKGARRTCNRHRDCDAADAKVRASTNGERDWADHCHDDCCEDCFGY